jgi:hypothetical protein
LPACYEMVSAEVRDFLAKYASSAEWLDILMLMHREPEAVWTAESVSNRVFTVPQAAERRLQELVESGLAKERADLPGAYALDDQHPAIKTVLPAVRAAYDASRADVIGAVFNLRADPLQSFSNAFRLRGDS